MHANIPANCINTNGLFAPGVRGGWGFTLVESSGESELQMRALRSRKLIPAEGRGRVSRGNKFRQIVLPALYTVAHEVERSAPPVLPCRPPHRWRILLPFLPLPPLRRPTVDTCTPGYCGWRRHAPCAPPPRNENVAISFPLSSSLLPIVPSRLPSSPFLASLLFWYSRPVSTLFSIFRERTSDFLIAIDVHSRSQRPSIAALACSNASAPRFSSP